jgi:predicted tellurium resistance membrane protein TerC
MNELMALFQWIYTPEAWMALFTLTMLEIVLGIDNIIFLSIVVNRLPENQQEKARKIGLGLAMVMRLILLCLISLVMGLTEAWFTLFGYEISGRDFILIIGGIFLILKSSHEVYLLVELKSESERKVSVSTFGMAMVQIVFLDIIFSLDSVITAVGMVEHITIMMIAVIISVGVMFFAAKAIGDFVDDNPSIKTLALAFLILIGFVLICEGFDVHIPKAFIYGVMGLSLTVELINMRRKKNIKRIKIEKCKTCGQKLIN